MAAMDDSSHWMPETPAEALAAPVRETVEVAGRRFVITRPSAVDRLIDYPGFPGAGTSDEYLPVWARLWPVARILAQAILDEPWPIGEGGQPLAALEIGCGLGLPGLAALARGLHVTFSDYDTTALRFAADNARGNGFTAFELLPMDWRHPPARLQFPVILGSDLIYQLQMASPLASLIKQLLAPGGQCLLTDQNRIQGPALQQAMVACQLTFTTESVTTIDSEGQSVAGTLYRIRHGG